MKIKIDDIQKIITLLLSELRKKNGNELELKYDYFWSISLDEKFDLYNSPKNITLGQISFDIESLMRLLNDPDECIPHDLSLIANILTAIYKENEVVF